MKHKRNYPHSPFIMSFAEYSTDASQSIQWEFYEDLNPNQNLTLIPKDFMGKWGKRFVWGIGCKLP
jgi:hypothetical protein